MKHWALDIVAMTLAVWFFFVSCTTGPKPRVVDNVFTFPEATYEDVWIAASRAVEQLGLGLELNLIEEEFGVLSTEWFTFHPTISKEDTNYTDCGTLGLVTHEIDRRGRLNLQVRENSAGVILQVNIEYEHTYRDEGSPETVTRECVSTGYLEGRVRTLVSETVATRLRYRSPTR